MTDLTHLDALQLRLSNERARLATASGKDRDLRAVWIAQMEREIDAEYVHLGLINEGDSVFLTDDELVAELLS